MNSIDLENTKLDDLIKLLKEKGKDDPLCREAGYRLEEMSGILATDVFLHGLTKWKESQ